jgi:hypothetical protein
MKRRSILKGAAGAGLAAGAGAFAILKYPRGLHAAGWGTWPQDKLDAIVPEDLRAQKVLEVHMNGGIGAWDTFYTVPSWGQGADPQGEAAYLHTFEGDTDAQPGYANPQDRFEQCGLDDQPYTAPFQEDGAGTLVHLGPWTAPLRRRPDILARMRIVVQYHDVLAHEGANPISFTGSRLGAPRLAGIGASIQRFFSEQPGGERAIPYSFVLYPTGQGFTPFNAQAASAIGFHPASARPLNVSISQNSLLAQLLERPGVNASYRADFDAAVQHYVQAYSDRLRPGGVGKVARSVERGNYEFAQFARENAQALAAVLSDDLFQAIPGQACGDTNSAADMPQMQAEVARSLLQHPDYPARYVQWIDVGINPRPEVGHDVHQSHVLYQSWNIPHTFEALTAIIQDPAQPRDPSLIDLDETMVVINMEFGRTPFRQVYGSSGTNHWPFGYVNVLIGGPIRTDDNRSPGASIYGNITEAQGYAQTFATPAENRIAVLSALGIYPFSSQSFAVADVRAGDDELESATWIRDALWGLSV